MPNKHNMPNKPTNNRKNNKKNNIITNGKSI